MKRYSDLDLHGKNTMHLHCLARNVLVPESEDELIGIVKEHIRAGKQFHVLGACSNVILPKKLKDTVILLSSFNKCTVVDGDIIEVGASVRVQHLIREAQIHGLGGIEYLFSVPCTVGGATVMNAGRGNGRQSIGNYIESVRCYNVDKGTIEELSQKDCRFSFRNSIFLGGKRIVLSACLKLAKRTVEEIEVDINERKQYALDNLDDRRPSCGSIFNACNSRIMRALMGLRVGGAEWSHKTANWISNTGNAKNWHVRILVRIACIAHKVLRKPYHLEVEIW